ncbi:MAG: hypothetical protein JWS10_2064 [Cypionkella sp.]|uniref:hypothetical protein n=1 Tax=Cypionkella sp. TaxID=2811411 RepID=UPI002614E7DE|nr:hypothetical protein [Cypionkella sp.]MDB5659449.1 hypothetical protein [Cypionkella sp.]
MDSFNEMPKKYWTDAQYELDLASFLKRISKSSIVNASRTSHGIPADEFETFTLASIDRELAEEALVAGGFQLGGAFQGEMVELVRRPFFYRLLLNGKISVGSSRNPRSIFNRMFDELGMRFRNRFQVPVDLILILERVAFSNLNAGTEFFSALELEAEIVAALEVVGCEAVLPDDVINWLISDRILQPLPKRKLAFFHQSVTEFLAASHLAIRFKQDQSILREVLRFRRWDQALMQTMALLPKRTASQLLGKIVEAEQKLALLSCQYLEEDRDQVILSMLKKCISAHDAEFFRDLGLSWAIRTDLPLNAYHAPWLRKCAEKGGVLGSTAVIRLAEIGGYEEKPGLIKMLLEGKRDYNFLANGVGELARGNVSNLAADILCDIAQEKGTQDWLDICIKLLSISPHNASVAAYFILNFRKKGNSLLLDAVGAKELEIIIQILMKGDDFALSALVQICANSKSCSRIVALKAEGESGLKSAILRYCADSGHTELIFDAIEGAVTGTIAFGGKIRALTHVKLDWNYNNELFIRVFKSRQKRLIEGILPSGLGEELETLGKVDFGDVADLILYIDEQLVVSSGKKNWFESRFASILGTHCDQQTMFRLVGVLGDEQSKHRAIVSQMVLPYCESLTISDLPERAISFLLAEMRASKRHKWGQFLIAKLADQDFVEERLLTLLGEDKSQFQDSLRAALEYVRAEDEGCKLKAAFQS